MIIKQVQDSLDDAFNVREEVFVNEQGFNKELVFADFDHLPSTKHYVCYDMDMKPIGTCVVVDNGDDYQIKRACVLKDYRKKGYGRLMIERVIEMHKDKHISLSSQLPSEAFYWTLGFRSTGDPFLEANTPHIKMVYKHGR